MTRPAPWYESAALHGWLAHRLSVYLERPPVRIDPTVPLVEYGLDSVGALSLCGDIEDDFGLAVDPRLARELPTVTALAGYLTAQGAHLDRPEGWPW
ncbi:MULTISPECIES: acyl carrier protein [Streptomyces]|uniref:Peptide carrier protein n=1 Tax=Streptomyces albus (strain ATCC 21838 / DSM 41398 / FERM P-419 / JCM 4703 / NBRC 107858) TaxID=1081613 RepID=H6D595_STRA4|nr:acyl carrier protein [Streptomyces sp. SCSIO ZS0520]AEZ53971.1 putative peptide carrier protein [Streptomyces albus]AJE80627.1 peptide carrier protein [Streptomyces albus]AOU74940.1 peptide carrier protein [Streptomyces albus]AYN30750.1 hypothetical protein DUI70_0247 [Streptomyces albus]